MTNFVLVPQRKSCLSMSSLLGWLYSGLEFLGLMDWKYQILLTGIDNAGKTTLRHILTQKPLAVPEHSGHRHKQRHSFLHQNVELDLIEIDCCARTMRYYPSFNVEEVDAIIFVVDAADPERLDEVKEAILFILDSCNETKPILIFGNKTDKKGCVLKSELTKMMGLDHGDISGHDLPICCTFDLNEQQRNDFVVDLMAETQDAVNGFISAIDGMHGQLIPKDINALCCSFCGILVDRSLKNECHPMIAIFMCSLVKRRGVKEGLDWMVKQLEHPKEECPNVTARHCMRCTPNHTK